MSCYRSVVVSFGAAPSAATSAAAILRRTSMPLHTSGRLGTSSLRASSRAKAGSGIIGQAKHSTAPGWRRRGRGHWISLRPGRKGAFPKIGKIMSTNDESFYDGVLPRRSRITTEKEDPMYYEVISQCSQSLKNMETWLDKAEQFAAAKQFDVGVLLNGRLAPDMKPLIYQV